VGDQTYLILDGENIDATLGTSLLGRKPGPDERPRWDRVHTFASDVWDQPVKALFFLNASSGTLPMPFIQALVAMDYRPIPLSGSSQQKVVDVGIKRMLTAILENEGDVLLASHDGDFLPEVKALLEAGRRVGILAFREFISASLAELPGIELLDLEHHANAFTRPLPRIRVIPLDEFDPLAYL
jgi:putative heme uptake system protein